MSFSKNYSRKKSEPTVLKWIEPNENEWKKRLLDLRPLTQNVISTSRDEEMAKNAVSYYGEDGSTFYNIKPKNLTTISTSLSFITDSFLHPGVLFTPTTMEHKWAIYFDGEFLIFIRSWLREVFVIAKTSQIKNELTVESITGKFTNDESAEMTMSILNFIIASHVTGEITPAPLSKIFENNLNEVGNWAFSLYGNFAHVGIFQEDFIAKPKLPLRSHSLLHIAVAKSNIAEIENLASKTDNLNFLAGDGLTPLQWSIASESTASLSTLLKLGADVNGKSFEGATPIMNASQSKKAEHLLVLLENGANVNAKDDRGFTALHRASEMGHEEIVKILLENGADKSIEAQGHTAISLAKSMKNTAIIGLLSDY